MSKKEIIQKQETPAAPAGMTLTNQDLYAMVNSAIFNGLRTKEEKRLAIKNTAKLAFARFAIEITESPACKALLAVLKEFSDALQKEWQEKMIEAHGKENFDKMDQKVLNNLYNTYFNANAARAEAQLSLQDEALTLIKRTIKEADIDYNLLLPVEVEFLLKYFEVV